VKWLEQMRTNAEPKKEHQDRIDSALCLLIAIRWRLGNREQSVAIGDLKNGYIVAPIFGQVMKRLEDIARERRVPIDNLEGSNPCLEQSA
jgi:predicted RNase H-like nuclease